MYISRKLNVIVNQGDKNGIIKTCQFLFIKLAKWEQFRQRDSKVNILETLGGLLSWLSILIHSFPTHGVGWKQISMFPTPLGTTFQKHNLMASDQTRKPLCVLPISSCLWTQLSSWGFLFHARRELCFLLHPASSLGTQPQGKPLWPWHPKGSGSVESQ